MSKEIPCFICKKLVEVVDDKAIAKLCSEHDTPENRERLAKTPVHQLLRILNESTQNQVNKVSSQLNETDAKYSEIQQQLTELQSKLDNLKVASSAPVEEPTQTSDGKNINKYGEVI